MFDFKKELERYQPILNVEHIEDKMNQDDIKDLIDILKEINKAGELRHFGEE